MCKKDIKEVMEIIDEKLKFNEIHLVYKIMDYLDKKCEICLEITLELNKFQFKTADLYKTGDDYETSYLCKKCFGKYKKIYQGIIYNDKS